MLKPEKNKVAHIVCTYDSRFPIDVFIRSKLLTFEKDRIFTGRTIISWKLENPLNYTLR